MIVFVFVSCLDKYGFSFISMMLAAWPHADDRRGSTRRSQRDQASQRLRTDVYRKQAGLAQLANLKK